MTTTEGEAKAKGQTLRVTRVIRAPRERVYNAFLDADAMVKWSPPHGYTAHMHKHEPRVGGTYRMSFSSLDKKETHYFGGKFVELSPFDRIRYTDQFESDMPEMQGVIDVTVTFKDVKDGTEVTVVQENLPAMIPLSDAQKGWGQSFDNLARLVEM